MEKKTEDKKDDVEYETDADLSKMKLSAKNVIKSVVVRLILAIHSGVTIWRTVDVLDNQYYWFLGLTNILLVIDGLYSLIRLKGQERKWFCPCFFFYLCSIVPALWLLELDRIKKFDQLVSNSNVTDEVQELSSINGITLPVKLDPDTWREVLEQTMLFLLIIGRWLLPRGSLTRDQLSQLLFVYIGAASDVMELFVVFEEPEIRRDTTLTYLTFSVWTLSLFQFTLVLTATRNSNRFQAVIDEDGEEVIEKKHNFCGFCVCTRLFEIEIWSLMISILIMDGPFLCIRVYALVKYQLVTFGILFFVCKNALMISLLIYRIIVVCASLYCHSENDEYNVALAAGTMNDLARRSVVYEARKLSLLSKHSSTVTPMSKRNSSMSMLSKRNSNAVMQRKTEEGGTPSPSLSKKSSQIPDGQSLHKKDSNISSVHKIDDVEEEKPARTSKSPPPSSNNTKDDPNITTNSDCHDNNDNIDSFQ